MRFRKILPKDSHHLLLTDTIGVSTLGYGTWQSAPGEVSVGVYEALKAGYRHLVSLLAGKSRELPVC